MPEACVIRDETGLVQLEKARDAGFQREKIKLQLIGNEGEATFSGVKLDWTVQQHGGHWPMRADGLELFDADKVGRSVVLRHWRPGDRFQPIGMRNAVKLQDFFTNAKVSRTKRHELILAETVQGEVFWVEGFRISERFKLTESTNRRLKWRWQRL